MEACPQVENMTLKASGRGPALILFTAFALLLSGGVFLVMSTALSAGVLSPAKVLTLSPQNHVNHLATFVRNHRKPQQAGGDLSGDTAETGREQQEGEEAPRVSFSAAVSWGRDRPGEESVGKGALAESSEAADLMLPLDLAAHAELSNSEVVLKDGLEPEGESITTERGTEKTVGVDWGEASGSLMAEGSADRAGGEEDEAGDRREGAESRAAVKMMDGSRTEVHRMGETRVEESILGGTGAGEIQLVAVGAKGDSTDGSDANGNDLGKTSAGSDKPRASTDLTSGGVNTPGTSTLLLRGMEGKTGAAPSLSENKPVAITNFTIEATLEKLNEPALPAKEENGGDTGSEVLETGAVSETKVVSKRKGKGKGRKGPDAEELFENFLNAKALAVDRRVEKGPVSKIAFLFLTRGPLFHELLWQRFFQGNENRYSVYVHASTEGFVYNETTSKAPVFHDRQIKSIKVTWGGLNMVRAERRLLAYALMDRSNERFVLVSESCIPLRTFDYTYSYMFALEKSFISSFPTKWRYKDAFAPLVQAKDWRKGAQWFTLTRKHARIVVKDVHIWRRLQSSKAQIADEHYIQSMLPMKDASGVVRRPLTYAAWIKRKANHPRTFVKNSTRLVDVREIQNMTRPVEEDSSYGKNRHVFDECVETGTLRPCYLFARKFTKDTTRILLGLADDMWTDYPLL